MNRRNLPEGKLPIKVLKPILETIPPGDLLVPTRIGMDAAITRTRGKYAIFSSGSLRGNGKRSVEKLVIDLAKRIIDAGAVPRTISPVVLFPKGSSAREIRRVMLDLSRIATKLGITVAKGHTEITPWLDKLTIVVTIFGSSNKRPIVRH